MIKEATKFNKLTILEKSYLTWKEKHKTSRLRNLQLELAVNHFIQNLRSKYFKYFTVYTTYRRKKKIQKSKKPRIKKYANPLLLIKYKKSKNYKKFI